MRLLVALTLALTLMTATGCGSKISDAKKRDVARLTMAMRDSLAGSSPSLLSTMQDRSSAPQPFPGANTDPSCVAPADSDLQCTMDCARASSGIMSMACTIPNSDSKSCGGTTYTMSNGSVNFAMDMSALSSVMNGGAPSGKLSFNLDMAFNVSGGEFKGERLACKMKMEIDLAAASSSAPTSACDGFNCTIDGDEISCEDFQDVSKELSSC